MRWLLALLLVWAAPAAAQAPVADPALIERIDGVVAILDGTGNFESYFAQPFKTEVPKARLDAIAAELNQLLGKPLRVSSTRPVTRYTASLTVAYERGAATVEIAIDPAPPHSVTGLIVRKTDYPDDSFDKLTADFVALPGASGFGIYALDGNAPRSIAERNGDTAAPIGSGFKLWLLAELARQVKGGARHWGDVIPLGTPSLPSGIAQDWPAGTPVTLQSLATLMISISDNTASDTLLRALGRPRVETIARANGAAPATFPLLSTREAFALKSDPARIAAWTRAGLAERRRMLADPALAAVRLEGAHFGDSPLAIDSIEWFASPRAMARLLGTFKTGDETMRAILAVTPGTDPSIARLYDYVGYKGGSEPGVVSASYLLRRKDGRWMALTGNWHRGDGETPGLTFFALMNRALVLAAKP